MTAEPHGHTLDELRREAAACTGCALHERATRTVFGEGPESAEVMLVGEQPGDREDRAGQPFVGPSGRLLDEALVEAGIDRSRVYVTNAVKHFKWVARGKRRIHATPLAGEVNACRPWLEAEMRAVAPRLVVCLGATAARAVLGPGFRVTQRRGEVIELGGGRTAVATVHPSAVVRVQDPEQRAAERHRFVADLAAAARQLSPAAPRR
jgi:uracil-DNA glycosylase